MFSISSEEARGRALRNRSGDRLRPVDALRAWTLQRLQRHRGIRRTKRLFIQPIACKSQI